MNPKKLPDLDLDNYGNSLSLAQVIAYFDRLGIELKPTTIQNYIRVGVLKPVLNRRYTKQHLVYLTLIHHLRDTLSLEQIKHLFGLADFGTEPTPLIAFYELYRQLNHETVQYFFGFLQNLTQQVDEHLTAQYIEDKHTRQLMIGLLQGSLGAILKNAPTAESEED